MVGSTIKEQGGTSMCRPPRCACPLPGMPAEKEWVIDLGFIPGSARDIQKLGTSLRMASSNESSP